MQSFVIASKDKNKREEYALLMCKDREISDFDIILIEPKKINSSGKESQKRSVGIEDIRIFQEKIFLKPFKSKTKAVIIKTLDSITLEAQNSLLKILEEPPVNTIIILTISSLDLLLPTILSRCNITELKERIVSLPEQDFLHASNTLALILNKGPGQRLYYAQQNGKDKDETLTWLEKMILTQRQILLKEIITQITASDSLKILKLFQETHAIVATTNVNPRFAIENLLLNLIK